MITTMGYGSVVMLLSGILKRQLPTGTQIRREPTVGRSFILISPWKLLCLFVRSFICTLRETEGIMKSFARIMKADIILTSIAFPSAASLYPGISRLKQWSEAVF